MAKVLAKYPASGGNTKYDWAGLGWDDGRVWKATQGIDFESNAHTFRNTLYVHANRIGKRVRASLDGDNVIFQFYE